MDTKKVPKRPGLKDRINYAILSQYARAQSYARITPEFVPNPNAHQNLRMRSVRWAVNFISSGTTAAGLGFISAWRLRTEAPADSPDFSQTLTIIGCTLAGWMMIELLRLLLPREFDLGEKASFGHRWRPDPKRPEETQSPSLAHRAIKQSYGMLAATLTAVTAILSMSTPYSWPAAALILAAIAGECLASRRNPQGEWQSLSDRLCNMRHCLKTPAPRPTRPNVPGPGGGKRTTRRKRSREQRRAEAGTES